MGAATVIPLHPTMPVIAGIGLPIQEGRCGASPQKGWRRTDACGRSQSGEGVPQNIALMATWGVFL